MPGGCTHHQELSARPEGERDHGSPGAGGNRHGVLSPREDRRRGCDREEPVVEPGLGEGTPGYDEEARIQYTGGLSEDTGEGSLAE